MHDAPRPPDDTSPNSRYQLLRKIAEGGSAVVHLAWDTVDRQYRAIKMLQPELAKKPALRNRFEREGRTMAGLEHPNIIKVFEAVNNGAEAYLVMEYAEAGSVIEWLERNGRPMPPRMAATIGLELCAGIAYAHSEQVIHRDIKPHNLLLDRTGHCKVTDFGIAQAMAEPRMTMTGTVMGTVGYMAPEQHESAKHADERADVYSIAATLYTLVVGEAQHHLFMAEDRDFERIPKPLAELIKRASQFRKEQRYSSVTEMASALLRVLEKLPPDPPDTPPLVPVDLELLDGTPPTGAQPRRDSGRRHRTTRGGDDEMPVRSVDSVEPLQALVRTDGTERTPSSIIPRSSFTMREQSRRVIIKSRNEMLVQDRIRKAMWASVLLIVLVMMGVGLTGVVGAAEYGSKDRLVNQADEKLMDTVRQVASVGAKVTKPLGADRGLELDTSFDKVMSEPDPAFRTGQLELLIAQLERARHDVDSVADPGAHSSLNVAIEELREKLQAYQERVNERESFEHQKLRGQLACTFLSCD
ncbi:MAG: serine/threonine-protein kinase [Myxococcota bacterium]